MIMKKTNFFYAAAIALVSTFGMTSHCLGKHFRYDIVFSRRQPQS